MTYSSKAIANLVLDLDKVNGFRIDQMKLQKLVYISHGWNLAIHGTPLINDQIQAWQYGPLIPTLYNEFKNSGRNVITDHATDVCVNENTLDYYFVPTKINDGDTQSVELVKSVLAKYGHLSGPQLSNLTHMPNTPWDLSYRVAPRSLIHNNQIKEHFVNLAQTASQNG